MRQIEAHTRPQWVTDFRQELARPFWVRVRVCLGTLVVALLLAIVPIPWAPETSLTRLVIEMIAAPAGSHLMQRRPDQGFSTYAEVAMLLAFVIAQPTVLWQIFDARVPSALPQRHRRIHLSVLMVIGSFLVGATYAYTILLSMTIQYLINWNPATCCEVVWQFSEYVSVVAWMMVWFGVAFELAPLVVSLAWLRIISREKLTSYRRYVLLLVFIFAAWITPTPDPFNQAIVAIPCYLLYEFGLLLARLVAADTPPGCAVD